MGQIGQYLRSRSKKEIDQIFENFKMFLQGRKVNDLQQAGLCPVSAFAEQISMLSPFGRRVLVLLGAPGVGRRTLKTMFLTRFPQYFTTAIPCKLTYSVPHYNEHSLISNMRVHKNLDYCTLNLHAAEWARIVKLRFYVRQLSDMLSL